MSINRYLLILFLLPAFPIVGQPTFNGYDVTNYELAKTESFTPHTDELYVSRKNTGNFDAILIYPGQKRFVFADQNAEDSTYQSSYRILTDRYGKENLNRDSIPSRYEGEDLELLHRLVRSKQARIHRQWNFSDGPLSRVILIWDHGGLTLVFDGAG